MKKILLLCALLSAVTSLVGMEQQLKANLQQAADNKNPIHMSSITRFIPAPKNPPAIKRPQSPCSPKRTHFGDFEAYKKQVQLRAQA